MLIYKKACLKYFFIVAIGTFLYIKFGLTKFKSEQEISKKMKIQNNLGD